MYYEFNQNNTGGSFEVNDKLTHRVIVQADSEDEAYSIAESMGVYFNGVDKGLDCECCGDRWYGCDEINIEEINKKGYTLSVYSTKIDDWHKRYGYLKILEEPVYEKTSWGIEQIKGKIIFNGVDDYVQFLSNEYGWCEPEARIFYKDGNVKEFFKSNKQK